jgi:hypothetical protein
MQIRIPPSAFECVPLDDPEMIRSYGVTDVYRTKRGHWVTFSSMATARDYADSVQHLAEDHCQEGFEGVQRYGGALRWARRMLRDVLR